MQASSSLLAERLLLVVFPLIEEAKRPQNPAAFAEPSPSRRRATRKNTKRDDKLVRSPNIRPLTVLQLEDIISQLLMYLGYLTLTCPENQTFTAVGPPPTLLVRLCSFPILYFSEER